MAAKIRRVNLSRLSPDKKKAAWKWIKENRPEQAELILQPHFQAVVKAFNGDVIIEMERT